MTLQFMRTICDRIIAVQSCDPIVKAAWLWRAALGYRTATTVRAVRAQTDSRPTALRSKSRSNTPVTPGLQPYCDQFFDQMALDHSKVSLRSHYGLNVVAVGRTSRRMVVLVVLVAVRNFGMFKIPYCDFSIAVQSVWCLSALVQLVLWSQYDLSTRLSIVALL